MSYLYETHLHTCQASACAQSRGADYIRPYREMGYSGIIITDHFYNGNTCIPRDLAWKEWVNQFCRGYEDAWNEGQRQGFDVFFGWEETFDYCDDYLIYGLDKDWLLEHPEVKCWTRGEQYRAVKDAGGCVVQAHPFRQHSYIRQIVLSTGCIDAVEAANRANYEQSYDGLAMRYAGILGCPITAGTDLHNAGQICNDWLYGIYVQKKLHSIDDYVKAVCNNTIYGIKSDDGRCDYSGDENIQIPVVIRDHNDRKTGKNWKDFSERR